MYAERFIKMDKNKVISCLENINRLMRDFDYVDGDDIASAMGCDDISCSECIFSDNNNIYCAYCGNSKSNLPIHFADGDAIIELREYLSNLVREITPYEEVDI